MSDAQKQPYVAKQNEERVAYRSAVADASGATGGEVEEVD